MSARKRSPKTTASMPSLRARRSAARIAASYSEFGHGQGSGIVHSGSPAAAACASTSAPRTSCMATRPSAVVVNSPATSTPCCRATCSAHAASLPPLHATSAFIEVPRFVRGDRSARHSTLFDPAPSAPLQGGCSLSPRLPKGSRATNGASADHGDRQPAVARPVELAEVDRLPASELQLPALHRDGLRRPDQRRLGVRVRIAFLMLVVLALLRHGALEGVQDVGLHVRVGVLVDGDGAGGVRREDRAEAVLHAAALHLRADAGGDVHHLLLLLRRELH